MKKTFLGAALALCLIPALAMADPLGLYHSLFEVKLISTNF